VTTDQRNGSETKKIHGQKKEEKVHEDAVSFKDPTTVAVAQDSRAFDYWSLCHNILTNFGLVEIMLCSQQGGQGTSESMHQVTKQVRTKTRNKQSGVVDAAYTEIKMDMLQQRATDVNVKKIIQRTDKVSVLGLVFSPVIIG